MTTFLLVIHVLICLFLIFVVLVQGGKGAEMGAAFGGGSSQTLFGGRGASTFLGKLTTVVAIFFMLTSLALAVVASKGGEDTGINLDVPAEESPLSNEAPAGAVLNETGPGGGFGAPQGLPGPAKEGAPAPSGKKGLPSETGLPMPEAPASGDK